MVMHASVISLVLYLFMVYLLKQSSRAAENRSLLIGSCILTYMLVFGHGLPKM
jgi:hypothetical protein